MSAAVRPIHLPSASSLEVVRGRAQAALADWARQWLSGWADGDSRTALHVTSVDDRLRSMLQEYQSLRSSAGALWLHRSNVDRVGFARCVLNGGLTPRGEYADPWMAAVAERAWQALSHSLCAALPGPASTTQDEPIGVALPDDLLAFGSGAIHLRCEPLGLYGVADRGVWRSVPPIERAARAPLVPVSIEHITQGTAVRLDAMLDGVDMSLADVLDLRAGDVLRLPHRLTTPVALLGAGKPVARAALGASSGRLGLQLTASSS